MRLTVSGTREHNGETGRAWTRRIIEAAREKLGGRLAAALERFQLHVSQAGDGVRVAARAALGQGPALVAVGEGPDPETAARRAVSTLRRSLRRRRDRSIARRRGRRELSLAGGPR